MNSKLKKIGACVEFKLKNLRLAKGNIFCIGLLLNNIFIMIIEYKLNITSRNRFSFRKELLAESLYFN